MANRKVTITVRVQLPDGRRTYLPAVASNGKRYTGSGTLKAGHGWYDNKPKFFEQAVYYVRYGLSGKQRFECVGSDPFLAMDRKVQLERIIEDPSGLIGEPAKPTAAPEKRTWTDRREAFLNLKRTATKKDGTPLDAETISAYEQQAAEFLSVCEQTYADEITANDLRRYKSVLRERGLTHRSICNNYTSIATFLKFCGIDHKALLPHNERPTPDDGVPEAYSEEEVRAFFAALTRQRDRLAFEFLLKTGCRQREMATAEVDDFSFGEHPTFRVQNKPHWNFRTKTGKARTIPLEQGLANKLQAWIKNNPDSKLVFGTVNGKEENHLLRICKETAYRAGLNCGKCKTCIKRNECERWYLHKFRDTFGTWTCRRQAVDLRTLQAWMGHASITMTERYLAPAEGVLAQNGINATFAAFA